VRAALCADFREEGWPSMDRVADRLLAAIQQHHATEVEAVPVCPPFARRITQVLSGKIAENVDRGINRLIDYPRHVSRLGWRHDVFHVIDHSYAQLVHRLPAERTVVTCHDLDTFRSILQPDAEPRSPLFNAMTRRILTGLQRAALVTCDTAAVRDELIAGQLVAADRVVVAPVGVGAEFSATADAEGDKAAARLLASPDGTAHILHVGSNAPRKRLDFLLQCCADVMRHPSGAHVQLIRVGGPFTPKQQMLARELGIDGRITVLPQVADRVLAGIYRRAAVLLLPSEREGFGLPVVEALACGTPVIASDLPVLREVGGRAVDFHAPEDREAWASAVLALLEERRARPDLLMARRSEAVSWAARFTWRHFADQLAGIYLRLGGMRVAGSSRSEPCPV
jgi:glycosyltransferase involved in cell wall biosynthesis